jgi:cytidylate kinase
VLKEYSEIYLIDIEESVLEESVVNTEPMLSSDVNKSDIMNYLINEDISLSDIYELL